MTLSRPTTRSSRPPGSPTANCSPGFATAPAVQRLTRWSCGLARARCATSTASTSCGRFLATPQSSTRQLDCLVSGGTTLRALDFAPQSPITLRCKVTWRVVVKLGIEEKAMEDEPGRDEPMDAQRASDIVRDARNRAARALVIRRPMLFAVWGVA